MSEEKGTYNSSEITELIKALCKAKKDFKPISKDGKNPFLNSKYVTLDAIINATKESLCDNGLVIMHHQKLIEDNKFLVTELIHESGQVKSTETCMNEYITVSLNDKGNAKVTPIQVFGLVITYLKRYHISELLDISVDEDNDGSRVDDKGSKGKDNATSNNPEKNADNLDRISQTEIDQILEHCKTAGLETETQALNKVRSILKSNHKSLAGLTMPEYATVMGVFGTTKSNSHTEDGEKNRKRAFAIADKLLINDEQIKSVVLELYGHESRTDMIENEWNQYCDYLLEYEKKPVTDEQIAEMKALPKPYSDTTLPKFLEFVNSNLTLAKEKTKDGKGNKVVHTPITKLEHMQIWEADYIIRMLKANPKE